MAATLPSPGPEKQIDEDAERLRTVLSVWLRQENTKFEEKDKILECVDNKRWTYIRPLLERVGLQIEGHYVAILRITDSHGHRLRLRSDCAYVISLPEDKEPVDKETENKERDDKEPEDKEPERGKIICKTSFVDLEAGDWLIVYPPIPQNKDLAG